MEKRSFCHWLFIFRCNLLIRKCVGFARTSKRPLRNVNVLSPRVDVLLLSLLLLSLILVEWVL